MSALLVLAAPLLFPAPPPPPPVPVRVVTADGKPVAGAKVWAFPYYASDGASPPEPAPAVTGPDGKAAVAGPGGTNQTRRVFARDPAGRVGGAYLGHAWEPEPGPVGLPITLVEVADRKGRLTTSAGKPVAGAKVVAAAYFTERKGRPGQPDYSATIDLTPWEAARTTDADGRFTLPIPVGYSPVYLVTADGFGTVRFITAAETDPFPVLEAPGTITLAIAGIDPAALTGATWQLRAGSDELAGAGTRALAFKSGRFDGTAAQAVRGVIPGKYELQLWDNGQAPGVFKPADPVEVGPGKTVTLAVKFEPGAAVSGKVVSRDTGQGIGGANVSVAVYPGADRTRAEKWLSAVTRPDGTYTAHGPAGWYRPFIQRPPDGYATVFSESGEAVKPARVEVGKAHEFAPIELLTAVTFRGRLVLPDGKPAAGAVLKGGVWERDGEKVVADADGRFAIKNLPPDDAVAPRFRLGTAVNVPETFNLEKRTEPVTIDLSEGHAATFTGRVTDPSGKPVAGATVSLRHSVPGVGRHDRYSSERQIATAKTDADGRYTFAGYWPKDQYRVSVTADGFAAAEKQTARAEAGQTHDFGTTKLARASLAVLGVVQDAAGKPVAGAELFGVDGPERFDTTSRADGSFTLSGFVDGPGWAFAKKAGYRLAAVAVTPGGPERVTITLAATDAPAAPWPGVTAEHKASLDRLTRHLLTRVWETRAAHGYGGNVLSDMARIDPETAKKWRDEEKARPGGKDLSHLVDSAVRSQTLLATAKEDVDEALAVLAGAKGERVYYEAVELARKLLPVDKEKAARVAEEVAVRARRRDLPDKVWSLAEAGDLAARAGNAAGGKKLLAEAADLAAKLDGSGRDGNAFAVGMVAARLAPYDWPRAEDLLESLKDPSEYNRWLSAACGRLAATDPAKAKSLFDRFKPDNSYSASDARVRVAYRLAATDPDEAEKVVAGVPEAGNRFRGYVGLALRLARTDKARAHAVIDRAFAMLDDPSAFTSWSNFGGAAAFGAMGAVRAAEIGHPDVAGLVARTLAARQTGRDGWGVEGRQDALVSVAEALALVDPPTARRVLAGVAPPAEYMQKAAGWRRDWLFALALADPDRATALVDKLVDGAKAGRSPDGGNAISRTGLVELGSILTAPDRPAMLATFGRLLRELGEDEE